jgi:hypothetical protein
MPRWIDSTLKRTASTSRAWSRYHTVTLDCISLRVRAHCPDQRTLPRLHAASTRVLRLPLEEAVLGQEAQRFADNLVAQVQVRYRIVLGHPAPAPRWPSATEQRHASTGHAHVVSQGIVQQHRLLGAVERAPHHLNQALDRGERRLVHRGHHHMYGAMAQRGAYKAFVARTKPSI